MEEWKPIKDFPEYEVSNLGRVKSLPNHRNTVTHLISPFPNSDGYLKVTLYNGKQYSKSVHRLVGEAFLENPIDKDTIDHINRNKSDNRVENLRWANKKLQSQNRRPPLRGTNTGQPNISYSERDNLFTIAKKVEGILYRKTYKTLEEAISYRDSILHRNSSPPSAS